MPKALVIVESPAKARTIAGYLGSSYIVESSMGNIRDLPRKAAEIPENLKSLPWAQLGVDVTAEFEPVYIVPAEKKEQVRKLKAALKDADEIFLATDEDREGESIAWHILEVLKPSVPVRRMVFHEISRSAIAEAIDHTRDLDLQLVSAQETRRILDRLYGYEVSPVLWKKVAPGLSAGRVQSVFTRLVVEREQARMRFRSAAWWDVKGEFSPAGGDEWFGASLVSLDGTRLATGKDFSEDGTLSRSDVVHLGQHDAERLTTQLAQASFTVRSVEEKPYRASPHAPFMTSTLQQEAGRKLRFSSRYTMQLAQKLYENGYITYMRTDSTALSETAVAAARTQIEELYGRDFVPDRPRSYAKKVRNAQEAHEAIRPGGDRFRKPDEVAREVSADEARLYDLIWKRTVASQMADAAGSSVQVRLGAVTADGRDAELAASGRTITFPGFLRAYVEGSDDPEADLEDRQVLLPVLIVQQTLDSRGLIADGHETQPPARYTEPSLVKAAEELGVGRPSTYAAMISRIIDVGYVWKKGAQIVPSWTAFAVVTLLQRHFADLVDYAFTARMEDVLDEIAIGNEESRPWLRRFYYGNGRSGLHELVTSRLDEIDAREINTIPLGTDEAGREIVVRVGRFGPYVQRDEETASVPEDLPPDELTVQRAVEILSAPKGDKILGTDPDSGLTVLVRSGKFGPYVQLGDTEEVEGRPRTASLFKTMSPDEMSLDAAMRLLSLPRTVGTHPETGEDIVAANGKFGPYLKMGAETRSLDNEEQIFGVGLDEAVRLLAEPKRRRGQRAPAPPLRELGDDPSSGKPVLLKEGRFGPYVTDGEVNASLRTGDDPDTITIERAAELLQARREAGPTKKKTTRKKSGAKTGAKKKAKTAPKRKRPKGTAGTEGDTA